MDTPLPQISGDVLAKMPGIQRIIDRIALEIKQEEPWKDEETARMEASALLAIGHEKQFSTPTEPLSLPPKLPKLSADPKRATFQKEVRIKYQDEYAASKRDRRTLDELLKRDPVPSQAVAGALFKEEGAVLFKQGKYEEARIAYAKAIRRLLELGAKDKLPSPFAHVKAIVAKDIEVFVMALACASNAAQCAIKEKKPILALDWIQEVHSMFETFLTQDRPMYMWKLAEIPLEFEELASLRMKAYLRQAAIFKDLGNTSSAYTAQLAVRNLGHYFSETPAIAELEEQECNWGQYWSMRHPDPESILSGKQTIILPELQVRGIWKRLKVGKGQGQPVSRAGIATCVWEGKYYIFGGKHGTFNQHRDSWVIDLRNLDQGWRKLPDAPWPSTLILTSDFKAAVHAPSKKAYILVDSKNLMTFNLVTESWESNTRTRLKNRRHEVGGIVTTSGMSDYCVEVIGDTLLVFGGSDSLSSLGRNRLLALDLKTLVWETLSGTPTAEPDNMIPGPREQAVSWIVGKKLYVGYGNANRARGAMHNHPEGNREDHNYCDLWCYDFEKAHKWVQQKMRGSFPCGRTESAYTFNRKWKSAVVFGGYAAGVNYREPSNTITNCGFSYFADTFLWDQEKKIWKTVITKEFPTYRVRSDMVTDQETGKSYLFGGFTSTVFSPSSRSTNAQSFNDLWELRVELPDGGFKEEDWEAASDARFAKLGPCRSCFTCGSIGKWPKCAGSCKDSEDQDAAFCSEDCQKKGWSEHKRLNGCRKISG